MVNMWIFAAVVTAILTFYLAVRNGYVVVPEWISNMWIVGMVSNIDSGCFKVLFSSYQIIQSVSFTYVFVISLLLRLDVLSLSLWQRNYLLLLIFASPFVNNSCHTNQV